MTVQRKTIDHAVAVGLLVLVASALFFAYSVMRVKDDLFLIKNSLNGSFLATTPPVASANPSIETPISLDLWVTDKIKAEKVQNTLLVNSTDEEDIKSTKYVLKEDDSKKEPLYVYYIHSNNQVAKVLYRGNSEYKVLWSSGKQHSLDSLIQKYVLHRISPDSQSVIVTDFTTSSLIDSLDGDKSSSLRKLANMKCVTTSFPGESGARIGPAFKVTEYKNL